MFNKDYLQKQKIKIQSMIDKYNDLERIKGELENGDLSDYTKQKQRILVPKLTKALHKIHVGNYGYCEKCNHKIELQRLEIVPAAEHCIECMGL
jgi:RNA polymerase-binding protein DksA